MTERTVIPAASIVLDDKIIFSDLNTNCIYSYDIETGLLQLKNQFRMEDPFGYALFHCALFYKDIVIFIPRNAEHISCYNPINNEIYNIDVPDEIKGIEGKFRCALVYNDALVLFGHNVNGIWIYSFDKKSFLNIGKNENEKPSFFERCLICDNEIYAVSVNKDAIWCVDIDNSDVTVYNFSDTTVGYLDIVKIGNKLLLLPYEGTKVIEFNINDKNHSDKRIGEKMSKWEIGGSMLLDNRIVIFRRADNAICIFDEKLNITEKVHTNYSAEEETNRRLFYSYGHPMTYKNNIICLIQECPDFIILSKDMISQVKKIVLPNELCSGMKVRKYDQVLVECNPYRLDEFILEIME